MNSAFWTLSWILMIGGGLLFAASAVSRAYEEEKQRYKGKATGTVEEIVAGSPDKAGAAAGIHDYYYPVIAYYANGLLYKERYRKGGNPCPYTLNQKFAIRYDEKDPSNFRIVKQSNLNKLSELLHYAGMICCIGGGVIFLMFAMRLFTNNS